MPSWLGIVTYWSSGTRLAIQWWPPTVSSHQISSGVAEGDAVHLVGAVLLEQRAQPQHALAGGADIGQDDGEHVLLADPADLLGDVVGCPFTTAGGPVLDEGIGTQHALIGGEGLGGAHRDVGRVDTGRAPDPLVGDRIRRRGVSHRVVGQLDGEVADDAGVAARLVGRGTTMIFFGFHSPLLESSLRATSGDPS